jgi:hypothetical protein
MAQAIASVTEANVTSDSWSPRGVLTAGLNAANFRYAGQMTQVAGGQLFQNVDIVPVDPEHMVCGTK